MCLTRRIVLWRVQNHFKCDIELLVVGIRDLNCDGIRFVEVCGPAGRDENAKLVRTRPDPGRERCHVLPEHDRCCTYVTVIQSPIFTGTCCRGSTEASHFGASNDLSPRLWSSSSLTGSSIHQLLCLTVRTIFVTLSIPGKSDRRVPMNTIETPGPQRKYA